MRNIRSGGMGSWYGDIFTGLTNPIALIPGVPSGTEMLQSVIQPPTTLAPTPTGTTTTGFLDTSVPTVAAPDPAAEALIAEQQTLIDEQAATLATFQAAPGAAAPPNYLMWGGIALGGFLLATIIKK